MITVIMCRLRWFILKVLKMIRCGFFNSVGNDRVYNAEDMNEPYKMLISNGVFATQEGTPSNLLQVFSAGGMNVTVRAGRGIFADKWFESTSDMPLALDSGVANPRIDSIVVRIDESTNGRFGEIAVKKGTPSANPLAPVMVRSATVSEYRLADVLVSAYATSVSQADISDMRGSADCGWVTSLVQQVDTSTLYAQWQQGFEDWLDSVKATLTEHSTFIAQYSNVVTATEGQTVVNHGIEYHNSPLDILQVFVNGFMVDLGTDYTVNGYTGVTFTYGLDAGTTVKFVLWKIVDGSEYEDIIGIQEQLNGKQDKLTAGTGITIADNVISATGGGSGLEELECSIVNGKILIPADEDEGIYFVNVRQGTFVLTLGTTSFSNSAFYTGTHGTIDSMYRIRCDYDFDGDTGYLLTLQENPVSTLSQPSSDLTIDGSTITVHRLKF